MFVFVWLNSLFEFVVLLFFALFWLSGMSCVLVLVFVVIVIF